MDVGIDKLLWGLNSVLVVLLGFFVRNEYNSIKEDLKKKVDINEFERIIKDMKESQIQSMEEMKEQLDKIESKLDTKSDVEFCRMIHDNIKNFLHTHAKSGQSGEVVPVNK